VHDHLSSRQALGHRHEDEVLPDHRDHHVAHAQHPSRHGTENDGDHGKLAVTNEAVDEGPAPTRTERGTVRAEHGKPVQIAAKYEEHDGAQEEVGHRLEEGGQGNHRVETRTSGPAEECATDCPDEEAQHRRDADETDRPRHG